MICSSCRIVPCELHSLILECSLCDHCRKCEDVRSTSPYGCSVMYRKASVASEYEFQLTHADFLLFPKKEEVGSHPVNHKMEAAICIFPSTELLASAKSYSNVSIQILLLLIKLSNENHNNICIYGANHHTSLPSSKYL